VDVDGVLKEWGDRLFYTRPKGKKAPRTIGRGTSKSHQASKTPAPNAKATLRRTVNRAPEVMVKITQGKKDPQTGKRNILCKDMKGIKAHFDYISRNGQVELEDERGQVIHGVEVVRELRDDWKGSGGHSIPYDGGYRREAFNIVLSMPPGTDREGVLRAARAFAKDTFANHQYVLAAHNDEAHPHVHLCVKAVSLDLVRLNPRKADLQAWREAFAEKLRENGIEANATARAPRGRVQKPVRQQLRHLERRGQRSKAREGRVQDARDGAARGEPRRPGDVRLSNQRREVLASYRAMATALAGSSEPEDRKLAVEVVDLVKRMDSPISWHGRAVDQISRGGAVPLFPEHTSSSGRIQFLTEPKNERPDYKRTSAGYVQTGAKRIAPRTDLHQPDPAAARTRQLAAAVSGLRNVSGIGLVRQQASAQVLLHANARNRVGQHQQGAPDHDVRRSRNRPDGIARAGDQLKPEK